MADATGAERPTKSAIVRLSRDVGRADTRRERSRAIDRLAETVGRTENGWAIVGRLLAGDAAARRFGLELTPRLPPPVPAELVGPLGESLAEPRLPDPLRLAVAAHLLCSLPPTGPVVAGVIDRIVGDTKPTLALDRLRDLAARVVGCDALEERITRLEERVPMRCPRCREKLPRPEMVKHLWQEHRLMLEGRRVRDPWRVIELRLREYAATGESDLLERATELAEQLDPGEGALRVQRLLLAAGGADDGSRERLREEAARRGATLCPHCCTMVPDPAGYPIPPMTVAGGRIACRGRSVEVFTGGLLPRLAVTVPGHPVEYGREPGGRLTESGRSLLFAGPWVVLAVLAAAWVPREPIGPLLPTTMLLSMAALFHLYNRRLARLGPSRFERAVGVAWDVFVPDLARWGYTREDGDFVASLARVSVGVGDPRRREPKVAEAVRVVAEAVDSGDAPLMQLVPLRRLQVADSAAMGRDAILILAEQAAEGLDGRLPLDFAEHLVSDWVARDWWTRRNQARLRVLLCARAFEVGLGVWEIQELGRFAPHLAAALRADDLDGLAALRRLWELTPERAWERSGQATTVFDLARYPELGGQYLHAHSDLLLYQPTQAEDETGYAAPILVCEEGVVYRDRLIRAADGPVTVRRKPILTGGGFELRAGEWKMAFPENPKELAERLNGWVRFVFKVFRPTVGRTLKARHAEALERLLGSKRTGCPDCGGSFLRGPGGEGVAN